jgi:hypothetical protein
MPTKSEAAMQMAIDMLIAKGGTDRQHIESMLKADPWLAVGKFASYACQTESLRLEPWEVAPVEINDPNNPDAGLRDAQRLIDGRYEAAKLLREMISLGISKWHPDPKAAIAQAKRHGCGDDLSRSAR